MKKEVDRYEIIDLWLKKYHGITAKELTEKEPELVKTPAWFGKYPVTQKQYDEWKSEARAYIKKRTGCSKVSLDHSFPYVELDCGPTIRADE